MVRQCLENKAPTYVSDQWTRSAHRHQQPTSTITSQHQLTVLQITFARWAFSVVNPTLLNLLPTEFRDLSVGFGVRNVAREE